LDERLQEDPLKTKIFTSTERKLSIVRYQHFADSQHNCYPDTGRAIVEIDIVIFAFKRHGFQRI
jgi:hypothetical protein